MGDARRAVGVLFFIKRALFGPWRHTGMPAITFRTVSIKYLIFWGWAIPGVSNTETGVGLKGGPIVPRGICALNWTYVSGHST